MGNDMPEEVSSIIDSLVKMFGHIDLLLFDEGFYSKDLMMKPNSLAIDYLIFVPMNPQVKDQFTAMYRGEKQIMLHEFSPYKEAKKIGDSVHLAFLKQIFDHRTEENYDWCFAPAYLTLIWITSLRDTISDSALRPCSGFRMSQG